MIYNECKWVYGTHSLQHFKWPQKHLKTANHGVFWQYQAPICQCSKPMYLFKQVSHSSRSYVSFMHHKWFGDINTLTASYKAIRSTTEHGTPIVWPLWLFGNCDSAHVLLIICVRVVAHETWLLVVCRCRSHNNKSTQIVGSLFQVP